jgi:hypothetical protein
MQFITLGLIAFLAAVQAGPVSTKYDQPIAQNLVHLKLLIFCSCHILFLMLTNMFHSTVQERAVTWELILYSGYDGDGEALGAITSNGFNEGGECGGLPDGGAWASFCYEGNWPGLKGIFKDSYCKTYATQQEGEYYPSTRYNCVNCIGGGCHSLIFN